MAKRKRQPVTWSDYRRYVIELYTHTRDAEEIERRTSQPSDMVTDGQLRGFFLDHERWGIAARPERWPGLYADIYLPRTSEQWNLSTVLANAELIRQTLGDPRHNRAGVRAFADLWSPQGPLAIPDDEWRNDPEFQKWLDDRRKK